MLASAPCGLQVLHAHALALPLSRNCPPPHSFQVHVHVPEQLAQALPLQGIHLELWSPSALISTSTVLVLPASLPALAAEVQLLQTQQAEGGALGVAQFLADAAEFIQGWGGGGGGDGVEGGEGGKAGCALVRQAVVWGLPGLATLLVGCLMAMPPCGPTTTPARFAQLAHAVAAAVAPAPAQAPAPAEADAAAIASAAAPAPAAAAAAAAAVGCGGAEGVGQQQEQGGCPLEQLGGLLHLALRSPNPSGMLQAVLGLGRQYGGKGGQRFEWRWSERSAVGPSPLCILGSHERLLQQLLQDPAEGPALREAAAGADAALRRGAGACPEQGQQEGQGQTGVAALVGGQESSRQRADMQVRSDGWVLAECKCHLERFLR